MGDVGRDIPIDAALYLFYMAVEYAFKVLKRETLITTVFKNNKRALKIDKILGYEIIAEGKVTKNSILTDIYILKMSKEIWHKNKLNFNI